MFLMPTLNNFTDCSSVSIVHFELVNAGLVCARLRVVHRNGRFNQPIDDQLPCHIETSQLIFITKY